MLILIVFAASLVPRVQVNATPPVILHSDEYMFVVLVAVAVAVVVVVVIIIIVVIVIVVAAAAVSIVVIDPVDYDNEITVFVVH